jgi:hypothetical protein
MSIINGGCERCSKVCATGLDSHIVVDGKVVDTIPFKCSKVFKGSGYNFKIICYNCYDNHYSKSALREKRLNKILSPPWYKRIFNFFSKPFRNF